MIALNGKRQDDAAQTLRDAVDEKIDEAMRAAAALQVQDSEGKFRPRILQAAFRGIAESVGREIRALCRQANKQSLEDHERDR